MRNDSRRVFSNYDNAVRIQSEREPFACPCCLSWSQTLPHTVPCWYISRAEWAGGGAATWAEAMTFWRKSVPSANSPSAGLYPSPRQLVSPPRGRSLRVHSGQAARRPPRWWRRALLCTEIDLAERLSGRCGAKRPRITHFDHLFYMT